jgi:hypothetical protein
MDTHITISKYIRSNGGWNQFIMYPLHQVEYTDKSELRQCEQKYIDLYKPGLNVLNAVMDVEAHKINQSIYQKKKNICECGGKYTTQKNRHLNSKKHIRYVLALSSKSNATIVEAMEALSV